MNWKSCLSDPKDFTSPATLNCIPIIIKNLILAALSLSGAVAVILIIISGIRFIIARGDAKQIEGARKTMTYAILGLLLIFFSFLILNFIAYITGARCITMFGFNNCGEMPSIFQPAPAPILPPTCSSKGDYCTFDPCSSNESEITALCPYSKDNCCIQKLIPQTKHNPAQ